MYGYAVPDVISDEERERLILEHLPQVRLIARRIHERLPESVSLEDLVSTGTIGLIAAIDRFDPRQPARARLGSQAAAQASQADRIGNFRHRAAAASIAHRG